MRICIVYGGTSKERDVSISSGKSILKALSSEVSISGYDFNGDLDDLLDNVRKFDLVFNALLGLNFITSRFIMFIADFTVSGNNKERL